MFLVLVSPAAAAAIAEEMYGCGIRALEKLGKWSEAVSLLEQWRQTGAYDADNDKMVRAITHQIGCV